MPDPQLDPSKGVIKWSFQRAHQHLVAVVTGAIVIPLATGIAGHFLILPPHATALEWIGQLAATSGAGLLLVATLALLYAILLAPYEQRRALRTQLNAVRGELDEFSISIHEMLVLESIRVVRNTHPNTHKFPEYNGLTFHLNFNNEAPVPLRYSMRAVTFIIDGVEIPLPESELSYTNNRIGAGASNSYVIPVGFDSNPPRTDTAEGSIRYRVWYGPSAEPDLYEQEYQMHYQNSPELGQTTTSTQYWREPGGHDTRRIESTNS